MFKRAILLNIVLIFISAISVLCAFAECEHNFTAAESNFNLVLNDGFTHSYNCLNGCGSIGTVSGGINSKEQCSFYLASEKESDCVTSGKKIYVCKICFRSKEVTVPVKKHSYSTVRKLPTCTEGGYDLHICTTCGKEYRDNQVSPITHLSDGGIIESLPNVSRTGSIKISCRICGCFLERREIPKVFNAEKTPDKVKSFRIKSVGSSSVKLSWKKVKDAVSYKIYYSTDKKKWKSVTTVKTNVTVKKLESARKYYFKIRAVGNSYEGETGSVISVSTTPAKVILNGVKSVKKSTVVLNWKKISGVSGYEITYSLKPFSEKKNIKSVIIKKGNSKTLKKLKRGKKYYFRIRAYKAFDSKKIFGSYSKVKSLTIK